ncbi:MAG: family 78 glycoside hydrolase catalytic domain [Lachnospiraceae bacterium]
MDYITHQFKGKWITSAEFCELKPVNVFHRQLEKIDISSKAPENSHILFRKQFKISKKSKTEKIFIYISADDYYKLYINGTFICQGPAPGYPFHYYYNKVEITDFVKSGLNTIAVHTYYQGLINRVWVSGDDRHGLILDVEKNGKNILSSDEAFLCSYHSGYEIMGKCGYDTQFLEKYISGTAHEGFEMPEYNVDASWLPAQIRKYADYELFEQPVKQLVFEEIKPVLVWDENGVTADFGSNYVGYLCLEACGEKGLVVEILSSQELNEDGTVRWQLRANCAYREEWQLSGEDDAYNQFDYKALRYVRINIPKKVTIKKVSLKARHYPFMLIQKPSEEALKYHPGLIDVWNLCIHTLKYGVQEVIMDCMEREKGNYLGDGCYTALAYTVLTGDAKVLKKLIDDSLRSSFIDKGLMTCASCSHMQEIAEFPLMMYYTLYYYYSFSGDREYLEFHYDQLCEIMDYYRKKYADSDGLLHNIDKWCVTEWPSEYRDGYDVKIEEGKICKEKHCVINSHYLGAAKCLNLISEALGREKYINEEPLTQAFNHAFYDECHNLYHDSVSSEHISLIANAFPFMYGLYVDESFEDAFIKLLKEKGFTSVMLFGAFPILTGLERTGRKELMYDCLNDKGAWQRMLAQGATTTFEGWGKECKWNTSLFHLTLSYAVLFLCDWKK